MAKNKRRKRKKFIILCFIAFFVSYFAYTLFQQQLEIRALEKQKAAVIKDIERAQRELDKLQELIELGESDEFIEKIAREQLNMVGQDETIVKDISNIGN